MGFNSVSGPPCASSPTGPGLCNRPSVAREHNSVLMVRRTPPQVSRTAGLVSFLLSNLERVGRVGFTPLMTVVGTLALLNPMKRLIAASGWTRVADQTHRRPPGRGSVPPPPFPMTWIWMSLQNRFSSRDECRIRQKGLAGGGLLKGRAGGVEPATVASVC